MANDTARSMAVYHEEVSQETFYLAEFTPCRAVPAMIKNDEKGPKMMKNDQTNTTSNYTITNDDVAVRVLVIISRTKQHRQLSSPVLYRDTGAQESCC